MAKAAVARAEVAETIDMRMAKAAALIDTVGKLQADKRDIEDELRSAKKRLETLVPVLSADYPATVEGEYYACTVSETEVREITPADMIREIDKLGLKPGGAARGRVLNEVMGVRMGAVRKHRRLGRDVAERLSQLTDVRTRVTVRERR